MTTLINNRLINICRYKFNKVITKNKQAKPQQAMKQNEEQNYLFSNPICKQTYNSLPKIYGNSNTNKSHRSFREAKKLKSGDKNGVSRHINCINKQDELQALKNNMLHRRKHSNIKSRYLSLPRPEKCSKKNCSCSLTHILQQQIKTLRKDKKSLSPVKKKIKLRPLQLQKPDDFESEHKVAMRICTEPSMPSGLAAIIKLQRNRQMDFTHNNNQTSFINQVIDPGYDQFNNELTRRQDSQMKTIKNNSCRQCGDIPRSFTEQIAIGTDNPQSSSPANLNQSSHHEGTQSRDLPSRVDSNISSNTAMPPKSVACVEVQVNLFDDAIQKRSEKLQDDDGVGTQTIDVPSASSSVRDKTNLDRFKKFAKPRKSKYYISQQQSQQSSQQSPSKAKNSQSKAALALSRMSSSSLSLTSCLVKNLNSPMTQFKKLSLPQNSQLQVSRVKSTKSNGTFRIPSPQQYGQYLKSYRVQDPKSFNLKQLVKKPLFSIVQQQQSVFFGEYDNQKSSKNGNGINVTEKQIFQGTYENNVKIKGCERNIDGVYKGYFTNGKRQGYGVFQWNNGQRFEGNWKQGVKTGFGIWRSPKGDYYEGQWFNNRQHGEGVFKHRNSTYKGAFENFLKHGLGEERFVNGDIYIGEYKQGKPDGQGKYSWHDGSEYQGEFKNGFRSGHGKLKQANGNIYEGQFLQDFKHGQGIQHDKSGQVFQGTFQKGQILKGYLHKKSIVAEYIDNS